MSELARNADNEILDNDSQPVGLISGFRAGAARDAAAHAAKLKTELDATSAADPGAQDLAEAYHTAHVHADAAMWRGQDYYRQNTDAMRQAAVEMATADGVQINQEPPAAETPAAPAQTPPQH